MKVWILTSEFPTDSADNLTFIEGVFSTEEKAKAYVKHEHPLAEWSVITVDGKPIDNAFKTNPCMSGEDGKGWYELLSFEVD